MQVKILWVVVIAVAAMAIGAALTAWYIKSQNTVSTETETITTDTTTVK